MTTAKRVDDIVSRMLSACNVLVDIVEVILSARRILVIVLDVIIVVVVVALPSFTMEKVVVVICQVVL